jgi:hypothetical protein
LVGWLVGWFVDLGGEDANEKKEGLDTSRVNE